MNSRRKFLQLGLQGSMLLPFSGLLPQFLLGAGANNQEPKNDHVLVVVQLSGGNDGLNTVIPYSDDDYYKNRFTLAVDRNSVVKVNERIGLHPGMRSLDELLQAGRMCIVQGVGYPNPNRSHFESMDLWHTAHRFSEDREFGWLGRCVDSEFRESDLPALHLGAGVQPLALRTKIYPVPSIESVDDFKLNLTDSKVKSLVTDSIQSPSSNENSLLQYVQQSAAVALSTSEKLEELRRNQRGNAYRYPGSRLGQNLSAIAQLIGSGIKTRVYYTTLDGFDTHSNQAVAHQGLLTDMSDSIAAFMRELKDQGNDNRVATVAFSEFGRRVRENASAGTDHGTAAPLFVFGGGLKQVVLGDHPSLTDLDEGDLKFHTDYRCVYADLLQNWLGVDSQTILGKSFQPVGLFTS